MPIYDYTCMSCKDSFEHTQKINDDNLSVCTRCGRNKLKRLISAPKVFNLRGPGFYVNDQKAPNALTEQELKDVW